MEAPSKPRPHPRLFLPADGFDGLRSRVRSDAVSRRLLECLERKAAQFCDAPVCRRDLSGKRLLAVSRSCVERILTLALAARLLDEPRFARRAVREMLAGAAFADWNPSHFLDVAEMTFALAIGYDWLHDQLAEPERAAIAAAILEKGITPSFGEEHSHRWWIEGTNNWNQVCHAGMVVGALALAENDPALTARVVERAVANVPRAARAYAPDGAYAEGPTYWSYGTSFQVALIDALESATGHSGGLADGPGFLGSARYIFQVTGATGRYFNYSDSHEHHGFELPMLWFARRLDEPALAEAELQGLDERLSRYESSAGSHDGYRLLALALLWHQPRSGTAGGKPPAALPRHWLGRGETPVGIHRSRWHDAGAAFVAIKGGSPSASHGHMDVGTFVLEAGGVRWAVDLGMQDYTGIEQYGLNLWDMGQGSDRWKIFRIGSQGHNVPSFNGAPQLVTGHAPVARFQEDGEMPHTVVDLTSVYSDHVVRAWRGVALLADDRVLLQDEWTTGSLPTETRWQMLTRAQVSCQDGLIVLRQDSQEMHLRIIDADPHPQVEVIERSEPVQAFDEPNPGARMIVVTCDTPSGESRTLRILASLATNTSSEVPAPQPLEGWSPV